MTATVQLRHHLKKIGDIERLMAKIATQKISPRELNILQQSIIESNRIKNTLARKRTRKSSFNVADQCFHPVNDSMKPLQKR